jgi:outer membrane autotransporter protein
VASWLGFGISYRLEGTKAPAAESASSTMSYSNRFAIDASSKFDLDRFTPKLRVRFSNFTDFDSQTEDRTNYLRYRLGLGYNIKGIKLNPYLLAEFYQKTSTGLFSKGKYTAGLSYDFNKHHTLSAEYSYADKFSNLTKYHIFEIGYSVKF